MAKKPSPAAVTHSLSAQLTALQSPESRAFLSKKKPSAAAMERQQEAARRTLPRRGQIKARIFASLFRCVVPEAPGRKEKEGGKSKDGSSNRRRVSPGG